MKEIWLICSGCYSDIDWHGFFESEQEAKAYCEWKNKYTTCEWNKVWYSKVNAMSIAQEQANNKVAYTFRTNDYDIIMNEITIKLVSANERNMYCVNYDDDDNSFELELMIIANKQDKAIKIAQDIIAQIKDKYEECQDWELTMECFGGFAW